MFIVQDKLTLKLSEIPCFAENLLEIEEGRKYFWIITHLFISTIGIKF